MWLLGRPWFLNTTEMSAPSSTYRIQLHSGFTLSDLRRIITYLNTLGVGSIYASPIMKATPGSMHGYDVTDPHTINPEIGTSEEFRALIRDIKKMDMGWLQDIVPNHMAFNTANLRLMDVLERGPDSPFYRFFDIDWDHPDDDLKGKVMVPFLGKEPDECIDNDEIRVAFTSDGFKVRYYDTAYPLSTPACGLVATLVEEKGGARELVSAIRNLCSGSDNRDQSFDSAKLQCVQMVATQPEYLELVEDVLGIINDDKSRLRALLELQYYRLCYWKETDRRINYRRFFTVNELICLRMEDERVFEEYHSALLRLMKERLVDGLRIDHIDGLLDPARYTQELRSRTGDGVYIIAEKILEAREDMPTQWPLQGTSGYEFLSFLNQLLTNRKGARMLRDFYRELVPGIADYDQLIFESKKLILENYMRGEWENLVHLFRSLNIAPDMPVDRVRSAIGLFMLSLPVYRVYPDTLPLNGKTLVTVHEALDRALTHGPEYSEELSVLRTLFTTDPETKETHSRILTFLRRLMQFTGPLTAKGVEDTTFYIYNPLISHDEVGDSPAPMGMTLQRFHEKMESRQRSTPLSLNATATHDTKRGEDARVRINVLSRLPELWMENVRKWLELNKHFRTSINGRVAPGINDEYFIYQSILGGYPEDFRITGEFVRRVQAYLNKALREAKVNTNWSDPDEDYEKACEDFIAKILDPSHGFIESFVPFVRMVCEHAMVYSLSQTLIKLTAPGIPDVYQGCELWDLSFVDPDNRRPVDYQKRMEFLFQIVVREEKGGKDLFAYLAENRNEGIEKLYVTWKVLNLRRDMPAVFVEGEYIPAMITGDETLVAAYMRRHHHHWVLVVFPFGLARHEQDSGQQRQEQFVVLPEDAPRQWHNLFTGQTIETPNQIAVSEVFKHFPVALLIGSA